MSARYLIPLLILYIPLTALAEVIVYDHFDDGVLDPAWEVIFNEFACGWTYVEGQSNLHVTEICHDGELGDWAIVSIRRPCLAPTDFYVSWRFAWDSHDQLYSRQVAYLFLYDEAGDWIAYTGYNDAWISWRGQQVANIRDSEPYFSGHNTLPHAATAMITVNRVADMITCKWDNEVLLEAPHSAPLGSIGIRFYYMWAAAEETVIDESVDFIRVTDSVVTAAPDAMSYSGPVLAGIHPNPFNPQTTITFALDRPRRAEVAVYDLTGRLLGVLADRSYAAGNHSVVWNGEDASGRAVPSGTYIVRLETDSVAQTRKVLLLR